MITRYVSPVWNLVKKRPKTSIAVIVCILLFSLGMYALLKPAEPVMITETARQGDIVQIVELTGEVTSDRDLKLQFPITGIIDRVFVEEGDQVEAGQTLARLRSSGLGADVNSAAAQVASARADLENVEQGARPEEITIAQAAVANKRAALASAQESLYAATRTLQQAEQKLQTVRSETDTSLQTSVDTVRSTVSSVISSTSTAVEVIRGVLTDTIVADAYSKFDPGLYSSFELTMNTLSQSLQQSQTEFNSITQYSIAISALEKVRSLVQDTSLFSSQVYNSLSTLPESAYFTATKRESVKTTVATQRTSVQTALSSIDSALQTLRNTPTSIQTRIETEEAAVISAENAKRRAEIDIETFKTSLQAEEANLQLKLAGSRPGDIAAARARLNQAYASLQRAQDRYNDTIIKAPISGVITKVNLKEGELLSTSFESASAITMLGDSPYRIEVFIPEIDVPKVRLNMSGTLVLDAFDETEYAVYVSEIDPIASVIDGVNKYPAMLDFSTEPDTNIVKVGMTGDVTIQTNMVRDVVYIPARAVRRNAEGFEVVDVLQPDGTITPVSIATGLEGEGGNIEVISGIEPGQEIVVLQR